MNASKVKVINIAPPIEGSQTHLSSISALNDDRLDAGIAEGVLHLVAQDVTTGEAR